MADITAVTPGTTDDLQDAPNASTQYRFVPDRCAANSTVEQPWDASNIPHTLSMDSSRIPCRQPRPLHFDPGDIEQSQWVQSTVDSDQQRPEVQYLDHNQKANMPHTSSGPTIKSEISEKAFSHLISDIKCLDELQLVEAWASSGQMVVQMYQKKFLGMKAEEENNRRTEIGLKSEIQALRLENENKIVIEANLRARITELETSIPRQEKLLDESKALRKALQTDLSTCNNRCDSLIKKVACSEQKYQQEKKKSDTLQEWKREQQATLAKLRSSENEHLAQIELMTKRIQQLEATVASSETECKATQDDANSQRENYKLALADFERLINTLRSRQKHHLEHAGSADTNSRNRVSSKRSHGAQETHGGEQAKKARIEAQKQPLG